MKKPHIVTIGGGTGQSTLLRGLKQLPVTISAVVSMADDGGSTGVLRDEMGVLPPGDVRQCIAVLSDESQLVRDLFNYRFTEGPVLGHPFGNLFLTALEKVTGSFEDAVLEACRMLSVQGAVIPVTAGDMRLVIELKDGSIIEGETHLDTNEQVRAGSVARVYLKNPVALQTRAAEALRTASLIVIGPGDLWGSVVPPLLVGGMREVIDATDVPIVYVANLTNKRGLTDGFSIETYVETLNQFLGTRKITHVIGNTTLPEQSLINRYEAEYGVGSIVLADGGATAAGATLIRGDFVSDAASGAHAAGSSFIRHDPRKLAEAISGLIA